MAFSFFLQRPCWNQLFCLNAMSLQPFRFEEFAWKFGRERKQMLLSSDSVLHLHPRVSFRKTVCQCELYLEGDYVKSLSYSLNPYSSGFLINVHLTNVSCHSEVCYFTRQIFTQQDIPCGQITVNYLKIVKQTKKENVNFIGHQHGSKSWSGQVHCLSKDLLQPETEF